LSMTALPFCEVVNAGGEPVSAGPGPLQN